MSGAAGDSRPAFADPDLDLETRLALAAGLGRRDRLWAAMAQTDCRACGTDCRGLADALDRNPEGDPARCAPGGAATTRALRLILTSGSAAIARQAYDGRSPFGVLTDASGALLLESSAAADHANSEKPTGIETASETETESHGRGGDRLSFLGTGTSFGIPRIGCGCEVCLSDDPRDRRTRASVLLSSSDQRLLIDCGPDLRQQLLRHRIDDLDAVIVTHAHADHMMGLDDLRSLTLRRSAPLPIYADPPTTKALRQTFEYIFRTEEFRPGIPWMTLRPLEAGQTLEAAGFSIQPFRVEHGHFSNIGLRIGDFAYLTDVKRVPPAAARALEGVRLLVLDMLREEEHATHLSWSESLELVEKLGRPRSWLVHMGHEISHRRHSKRLPAGVDLAWDGLELELGQLLRL